MLSCQLVQSFFRFSLSNLFLRFHRCNLLVTYKRSFGFCNLLLCLLQCPLHLKCSSCDIDLSIKAEHPMIRCCLHFHQSCLSAAKLSSLARRNYTKKVAVVFSHLGSMNSPAMASWQGLQYQA